MKLSLLTLLTVTISLWISFSLGAHAAKPLVFCTKLADLKKKALTCGENHVFADAAIACVTKLEAEVKAVSHLLDAALKKGVVAGEKTQGTSQGSAERGYGNTRTTLGALVTMAQMSRNEVAAYGKNVVFPEDSDNPEIVGPDLHAFLKGSECYSGNVVLIQQVLNDFDRHIQQLSAAYAATSAKGAASGGNKAEMVHEGGKIMKSGKAPAPLPTPQPKAWRESDISSRTDTNTETKK